jgi:hypothetical protein
VLLSALSKLQERASSVADDEATTATTNAAGAAAAHIVSHAGRGAPLDIVKLDASTRLRGLLYHGRPPAAAASPLTAPQPLNVVASLTTLAPGGVGAHLCVVYMYVR